MANRHVLLGRLTAWASSTGLRIWLLEAMRTAHF
jgi:hypothetical protein